MVESTSIALFQSVDAEFIVLPVVIWRGVVEIRKTGALSLDLRIAEGQAFPV
jgi:hypothetical protein